MPAWRRRQRPPQPVILDSIWPRRLSSSAIASLVSRLCQPVDDRLVPLSLRAWRRRRRSSSSGPESGNVAGLLVCWVTVPRTLIGILAGFGAGALLSAVSFDLIAEAEHLDK